MMDLAHDKTGLEKDSGQIESNVWIIAEEANGTDAGTKMATITKSRILPGTTPSYE